MHGRTERSKSVHSWRRLMACLHCLRGVLYQLPPLAAPGLGAQCIMQHALLEHGVHMQPAWSQSMADGARTELPSLLRGSLSKSKPRSNPSHP